MNDEKTAVINMISDATITSSEGIALFETLCDLEGIGAYRNNVEVEDLRHLPPWESEGEERNNLGWLILGNEFVKAIALANHDIVLALQTGDPGDIPSEIPMKISALDLIQLFRFRLVLKRDVPSAFISGVFSLKSEDEGIAEEVWAGAIARILNNARLGRSPTWGEPTLMQIFSVPRRLRLKWEADEVIDEEQDGVRIVSTVESFNDSVAIEAGKFGGCLKLKITISAPGNPQPDVADENGIHDIHNDLRMIGTKLISLRWVGTQLIWFAPNVGAVNLLYEHHNNTKTEVELADYHVQGGEPLYFPLSIGNNWRYEWQDEVVAHRELIRVVMCKEDGTFILSCANHAVEVT